MHPQVVRFLIALAACLAALFARDAKALGQPPAIHNLEKPRGILLLSAKRGLS